MGNRILGVFLVGLLGFSVAGCSTVSSQDKLHHQEVLGAVEVNPALSYVYFYRPCEKKLTSKMVSIKDEDVLIGKSVCGSYFVYETAPGLHHIKANDFLNNVHKIDLTLEPGQKYFVKVDLIVSFVESISPLELQKDIDEGLVSTLKHVTAL